MIETRQLVSSAYGRRGGRMLTHAVEVADDSDVRVLCDRIKIENVDDRASMSETERAERPTCLTCERRDPRFRNGAADDERAAVALLRDVIEYVETHHPLPRCHHGSALRDRAGETTAPTCGCFA